nr:MAG TPA: hypothetical protein [Bacteriophage sp.]DAT69054.1 MAG TPA: hypothetical protein [Bacteriophage sp.]
MLIKQFWIKISISHICCICYIFYCRCIWDFKIKYITYIPNLLRSPCMFLII